MPIAADDRWPNSQDLMLSFVHFWEKKTITIGCSDRRIKLFKVLITTHNVQKDNTFINH